MRLQPNSNFETQSLNRRVRKPSNKKRSSAINSCWWLKSDEKLESEVMISSQLDSIHGKGITLESVLDTRNFVQQVVPKALDHCCDCAVRRSAESRPYSAEQIE